MGQGRVSGYHDNGSPQGTVSNGVRKYSYANLSVPTFGGRYWDYVPSDAPGIPKGTPFSGSLMVKSSEDVCFHVRFEQRLNGALQGNIIGDNTCIVKDEWTEMTVSKSTTVDASLVTLTAYSVHQPGSVFEYKDPIITFGPSINKGNIAVKFDQKYCIQGYNENDKTNIWHYSTLNGGVEQGSC